MLKPQTCGRHDLPLSGLQGVPGDGAARQGLDANLGLRLELGRAVHGQAQGQDQDDTSTGHAASNLSNTLNVAQRAQLQAQTSVIEHVFSITEGTRHFCAGDSMQMFLNRL